MIRFFLNKVLDNIDFNDRFEWTVKEALMYIDRPKKKGKDKIYSTCLLRESYRDENGKVKKRTLLNLSNMSADFIKFIEIFIKNKKFIDINDEKFFQHEQGKAYGGIKTVFEMLKKLGILSALGKSEPAKLAAILIAGIILSPRKSKNYIANSWEKIRASKKCLTLPAISTKTVCTNVSIF